jgi:hypothetical protein
MERRWHRVLRVFEVIAIVIVASILTIPSQDFAERIASPIAVTLFVLYLMPVRVRQLRHYSKPRDSTASRCAACSAG